MKYVFLRTFFLIVFVFQFTLTLTTAATAAAAEAAPSFSDCPTVWCRYSVETVAAHFELMSKLPAIERLDSKISGANFATAFFNGKLLEGFSGETLPLCVFVSNHIHDFEARTTYDRDMRRTFQRTIISQANAIRDKQTVLKISAIRDDWFDRFAAEIEAIKAEVIAPAERIRGRYTVYKKLQSQYREEYPFVARMKEAYPCFDSEASIARCVGFLLRSEDLSSMDLLELRIHSRFNPCFFCVQMLHHYAQHWSEKLNKLVRVFVSSQEEYHMPAEIMPADHMIPEGVMIKYGLTIERELTLEEMESFSYLPGRPGKIIQTFLPMTAGAAPAAPAPAATARDE